MKIKYRIWDNQENKYFKPIYEGTNGVIEELSLMPSGDLHMRTIDNILHETMFPNRFLCEMFTGLKDKNGKEIYEGDIVKTKDGDLRQVIYFQTGFEMRTMTGEKASDYTWYFDIEIIGNIHENKEHLTSPTP